MHRFQFSLLLFVVAVSFAHAHMCSLFPLQRGSVANLNIVGTSDCGQTVGPCGGRPLGLIKSVLSRKDNFTIMFMKNEDHYNAAKPGNFTFQLSSAQNSSVLLGSFPDTDAPSGTVYELPMGVPPNYQSYEGVFQAVYYTNNPDVNNIVFYACADVFLASFA